MVCRDRRGGVLERPGEYVLFLLSQVVAMALVMVIASTAKAEEVSSAGNHYPPLEDGMVLIPSGEFLMGSSENDGQVGTSVGVDEIPLHKVSLDSYFIDRYEVTNGEYKLFVRATGHPPPVDIKEGLYSWKDGSPPEGQDDIPVTYVSWYDAEAYCRWAGKRLPTEEQWEKAARGTDHRQWPWGNDFKGEYCNSKYTGPGRILVPGSLPEDVSPYGVYDMCGNVGEWTSSWFLPYPGSSLTRESYGKIYRIGRGGSWVMPALPYSRSAYRSNTYEPEYKHRGLGFRCVKDAE